MWPSGAPKCCLLMLFLSFSEPHFFKIRLSEPAGTKPLDLGKKKTCGRSGYILVSLCEIGKGVKEIWDRWRKGPLCRKRNCFRKRKTVEDGPGRCDDVSSKYNKLGVRARLEGLKPAPWLSCHPCHRKAGVLLLPLQQIHSLPRHPHTHTVEGSPCTHAVSV